MNDSRKLIFFLILLLAASLCTNLLAVVRVSELADKTERLEQALAEVSSAFLDLARTVDSLPRPAPQESID